MATGRKTTSPLTALNRRIVACDRCPRLIQFCARIAREKRAAYRDWTYHGRPVPSFLPAAEPESARVLIVGLAPAAHGANRTGRMFTGDRSGDFLYTALHRAGFASHPTATGVDDGLELHDCLITAALHCAPPANKPTADELAACADWLSRTFDALLRLRVVVCLGRIAFDAVLRQYRRRSWLAPPPARKPAFAHGAVHFEPPAGPRQSEPGAGTRPPALIACYHPSQQNTFTGRLTMPMLVAVFEKARAIVEEGG